MRPEDSRRKNNPSVLKSLYCIGHRGACGHAPENTLLSIRKAMAFGVDCVELDVYAVENELIVIHDATLDRTTNGKGPLSEHSLKSIRSLDAGHGEKIPFLSEVMDLIDARVDLNIELKGPGTALPVIDFLSDYLKRTRWTREKIILSSFRFKDLKKAKNALAGIHIGCLFRGFDPGFIGQAKSLHAWSVHFPRLVMHQGLVNKAHRNGFKVFSFTVNEPPHIRRMAGMGADGVFSDFPDRVIAFNKSLGNPLPD